MCLGATAAQALLGPSFRVTQTRGKALKDTNIAPDVVATVHPASVLRASDPKSRESDRKAFIKDLRAVKRLLDG